ncbi:MAG: DUF4240 domain-containing protein [Actinoplanes sp.]
MRLLRRAMPEDEFWALIGLLEGSTEQWALERLSAALQAGGKRKSKAFAERLAAVLYDLDREVLFEQPVRWSDDPDEADPLPLSSDSFLYLRAAVVAQGKAVVEEVIADPTVLLTREWDDGEALLYVADEEIETKFSYETGSNEEHWSPDDETEHPMPMVAVLLSDLLEPIEAYEDDAMTIPAEPVMYAWPRWFPLSVLETVNGRVDSAVRDAGGIEGSLDEDQIQIYVGFGDSWQVTPEIAWDVEDETGVGQVVTVRVELPQTVVRGWTRREQEAALLSLAATCCLSVLPADHASRSLLHDAASEGASLLSQG